jgi:hypothetical protein
LLPASSSLTGQQHHQRPAAAGGTAAGPNSRRAAAACGLRSTPHSRRAAATQAAAAGGSDSAGVGGGSSGDRGVPVDGMEGLLSDVSCLRFSRDERLVEVRQVLGTSMPVLLSVSDTGTSGLCLLGLWQGWLHACCVRVRLRLCMLTVVPTQTRLCAPCLHALSFLSLQVPGSESDADLPAKQQTALFGCALRTMAQPIGRGALMLGLEQPLPGACVSVAAGARALPPVLTCGALCAPPLLPRLTLCCAVCCGRARRRAPRRAAAVPVWRRTWRWG